MLHSAASCALENIPTHISSGTNRTLVPFKSRSPRKNRLYDSISQHLYHPDLLTTVECVVGTCNACQRQKNVLRGHGHTAPREAPMHPWRDVAVDLIGPWKLKIGDQVVAFTALTVIDTVTNLVELVRLDDKASAHVALQLENLWLSRYLHQGGEFLGWPFQQLLRRHGIKPKPTTSKNPQANAICERMHQAVGNTLRAMVALHPPTGVDSANRLVDTALANCLFATRSAIHGSVAT